MKELDAHGPINVWTGTSGCTNKYISHCFGVVGEVAVVVATKLMVWPISAVHFTTLHRLTSLQRLVTRIMGKYEMIFLVMKIDNDDGEGKIYFRIKRFSPNVIFIGGGISSIKIIEYVKTK